MGPGNNSGFSKPIENPRKYQKSIDFEENIKNMTFQRRESRYLQVIEQYSFKDIRIMLLALNNTHCQFPIIKKSY